MRFISSKIEWTRSMKKFAEETLTKKLDRLLDDFSSAEFKLSKINNGLVKVEISISPYRAQSTHEDFYAAVVEAEAKLKSIITRAKKKSIEHNVRQMSIFDINTDDEDLKDNDLQIISKEKTFILDPISLEDAIVEFEATDYPFYVYKDIDENCICVIYKRYGETYGRIKCN